MGTEATGGVPMMPPPQAQAAIRKQSEDDFRPEEIRKVTVAEREHRQKGLVCVITTDGKKHYVLPGKGKDRRAFGAPMRGGNAQPPAAKG